MKYLLARTSTWDMAGRCMIQGFMSGMNQLDKAAKYSALVPKTEHQEWVKLEHQFLHETQTVQAFEWADIVVDLGSIVYGFDQRRFNYIAACRKLDKPYMYGATYFMAPDPRVVKDIPAVATGPSSALFFEGANLEKRFIESPKEIKKSFPMSHNLHGTDSM